MRGRYKRRISTDRNDATVTASVTPRPEEPTAGLTEPQTSARCVTVKDATDSKKGARCSIYSCDKVYMGVRVKMPVRDILKNIRLAQGWEPQNGQGLSSTGDKKRVKARTGGRSKKKHPTKSLEELAIIVEVLEEDLKTGSSCRSPPPPLSSSFPSVSPDRSPIGYNSDESETIPSPQSLWTYSPDTAVSLSSFALGSLIPSVRNPGGDWGSMEKFYDPQNHNWNLNSSAFFWMQLQKVESQLMDISDAVLLTTDEQGRTALHKVACVGKRALGYGIAKRMAALNSLDLRDSDGMTALLHAANHNHHLMVADLIHLGANVNAVNNSGKSGLHLSAEKGYVRVLEVLKHTMMDGVYVDVEAADNSGMSALQCASLALKATVHELENSKSPGDTRLHTLRQEQMMETLEYVLQMGSLLYTMESQSMQSIIV
ncbi:uncharacterized protein V6R79_001597 [Siganus canaliculatus]